MRSWSGSTSTSWIPRKAAVAQRVAGLDHERRHAAHVESGSTADDIRDDLEALLGAFVSTNQNVDELVLIMPPAIGLALSLMRNALGQAEFPARSSDGRHARGACR